MANTLKEANAELAALGAKYQVLQNGESAGNLLRKIREIKTSFPASLAAQNTSKETLDYLDQVAKGTWQPQ